MQVYTQKISKKRFKSGKKIQNNHELARNSQNGGLKQKNKIGWIRNCEITQCGDPLYACISMSEGISTSQVRIFTFYVLDTYLIQIWIMQIFLRLKKPESSSSVTEQ